MISGTRSKQRVADHGEVFTQEREVNAMLDLVKHQTEVIESRFLEPACGSGNFLIEVLRRKLDVVDRKYRRSQTSYERYALTAISSLYGVDLLEDNVAECRERLFAELSGRYSLHFGRKIKEPYRKSVKFVLERNIIHGDALSLKTVGDHPKPLVFSEWSFVSTNSVQRRDFTFTELVNPSRFDVSDEGRSVFRPSAVAEYPAIHYLKVASC